MGEPTLAAHIQAGAAAHDGCPLVVVALALVTAVPCRFCNTAMWRRPCLIGVLGVRVPGGLEVAFAAVTTAATSGTFTTISGNLGSPPGAAIVDSAGTSIFEALREAANNPIAVVDLVDGHAWWETRLLVLLSGASRLNRPRVIVFLGTLATQPRRFLGWAPPADLLQAQLAIDAA